MERSPEPLHRSSGEIRCAGVPNDEPGRACAGTAAAADRRQCDPRCHALARPPRISSASWRRWIPGSCTTSQSIQHFADQLALADGAPVRQSELKNRLATTLDAARHLVRTLFPLIRPTAASAFSCSRCCSQSSASKRDAKTPTMAPVSTLYKVLSSHACRLFPGFTTKACLRPLSTDG